MRLQGATRTEPDVPDSGIRLPPWVFDGEAFAWPRMKDTRHGKPVIRQLGHSRPRHRVFLAPTPKRFMPESDDAVAKGAYGRPVCRDGMIRKKAGDDLSQPISLYRDWFMPLAQHCFLDLLEFRAHAVAPGFPLENPGAIYHKSA